VGEFYDKILAEPYLKGGLDLGEYSMPPGDLSPHARMMPENLFLSDHAVQN